MIIFEKLRWKNILSTGNSFTELNLTKLPNTLVIGKRYWDSNEYWAKSDFRHKKIVFEVVVFEIIISYPEKELFKSNVKLVK